MSSERLVIVVLDAVEPTLTSDLLAAGELPALAEIAQSGWSRAFHSTPADTGSGAVWPSFRTGESARTHGEYFIPWQWSPEHMAMRRRGRGEMAPWWRSAKTVLELDVPRAPRADREGIVQIDEWGAHDVLNGHTVTTPADLAERLRREHGTHPFVGEPVLDNDAPAARSLQAAADRAIAGARLRGDLATSLLSRLRPQVAVLNFPEWHHVGHVLWHDRPAVAGLLKVLDEQVGRIAAEDPDAALAVVSLHGMRRAHGSPTGLSPALRCGGYLVPRDAAPRSAAAALKARVPSGARRAWRRRAPRSLILRVAESTLLEPADWSRTRAFALPSDQHAWVRVNLAGRAAGGIVPAERYDELCDELVAFLLALRSESEPVFERVLRTTPAGDSPAHALPDVVGHWSSAALRDPLTLDGLPVSARPSARRLTGLHSSRGMIVAAGVPQPAGELDVPGLGACLAASSV